VACMTRFREVGLTYEVAGLVSSLAYCCDFLEQGFYGGD